MMSSSFMSEGDVVQGKCKNESESEVHKPLKNAKSRATVDGFVSAFHKLGGIVAEIFKPLGVSFGESLKSRLSPCS